MKTDPSPRRGLVIDRSGGRPWMTADGASVIPTDDWDVTVLVTARPAHVPDGVHVVEIGDFSAESLRSAVERIVKDGPLERLSTTSEHFLEVAAQLREEYNIAGNGVAYTARLRDKWLMKQCATQHAVRTLDGTCADHLEPWLQDASSEQGFVLKPRGESGSAGVRMAEDKDELRRTVGSLPNPGRYLIEVRSQHPILHVDVVAADGIATYQVSQYERPCHVSGRATPLSSYTVENPAVLTDVQSTLGQILKAWQVRNDVLHIELFADPEGVVLLELAGRPGAAGVPQVFAHTRGLDLQHAKTRLDFGIDPTPFLTPPLARHAGWTVIYAPTDAPAVVDDSALIGHVTRTVLEPNAPRIDGVAGLGVATYSFAADTVEEVRALIATYEQQVRVRPATAHEQSATP
jgi:hypothetical protein